MDRHLTNYGKLSLWEASRSTLPEIAQLVIDENYKHHQGGVRRDARYLRECAEVWIEELQIFDLSSTIVARDAEGDIVGAIRISHWNDSPERRPMQRLFGEDIVNPTRLMASHQHLWHVGRFAIRQKCSDKGMLFKLLMLYAITPIFRYSQGVLLAEADAKLLRVMCALRIDAQPLATGREYIGSLTVPIMVTREGLAPFFLSHMSMLAKLHLEGGGASQPDMVKPIESSKAVRI